MDQLVWATWEELRTVGVREEVVEEGMAQQEVEAAATTTAHRIVDETLDGMATSQEAEPAGEVDRAVEAVTRRAGEAAASGRIGSRERGRRASTLVPTGSSSKRSNSFDSASCGSRSIPKRPRRCASPSLDVKAST